jgi:DNA-binding IclR family transcriptional regulator
MTKAAPQRVTLQTAERALRFLEVLASSEGPLRIKDVSERLAVNLTTTYHLFNTLHDLHYVTRKSDGTVQLGTQVRVLYEAFQSQFPLGKALYAEIDQLGSETNETAYLGRLGNNGVVLELQVESAQPLRVTGLGIGFVGKEHIRAAGKAVLAYMDPDQRDVLLDLAMSKDPESATPRFREELLKELEVIRANGWAIDDEKYQAGVTCIAAPFFSVNGQVEGAVGISAPSARWHSNESALRSAVISTASEVSRQYGRKDMSK